MQLEPRRFKGLMDNKILKEGAAPCSLADWRVRAIPTVDNKPGSYIIKLEQEDAVIKG